MFFFTTNDEQTKQEQTRDLAGPVRSLQRIVSFRETYIWWYLGAAPHHQRNTEQASQYYLSVDSVCFITYSILLFMFLIAEFLPATHLSLYHVPR